LLPKHHVPSRHLNGPAKRALDTLWDMTDETPVPSAERVSQEGVSSASLDQQADRNARLVRIEASHGFWASLGLKEFWQFRGLTYYLVWRDIKVRYKQTVLGGLWAVIQPLFTMVVFTFIFGRVAKIPSEGLPYPLFSFAAIVPFQFFQSGVLQASESLVSNSNMIKKVYFPRLIAPTAAVLGGLVDFGVAFGVLIIMMAAYGFGLQIQVLFVPLFLLLALITALGLGLWLAGLNAQFRDIRYTMSFIMQALLFLTPVAYPVSVIHEPWRTLYILNPMVAVVEGFRWALLGSDAVSGPMVFVGSVVGLALLVSGAFFFRRLERTFADVV
jgi:lipopolysaccharide transport system permease protein